MSNHGQLLKNISITKAIRLLRDQKLTSCELVSYCYNLAILGEEELKLNAYVHLAPSLNILLEQARAADHRIKNGRALSPIDGIPVSIKANIACKGMPFHACSRILGGDQLSKNDSSEVNDDQLISGYDSDVTKKLIHNSGAILIGQTNMDEFGMGSLGFHSAYGPTRNPLFLDDSSIVSAGGSSSGAAAAVSHGSCLAAIGTDTGGSVRLPAAWCDVSALKPTYGLISRHGIIAYASSLDTVGIIARTPACTSLVLDCIAGQSEYDATSIPSLGKNGDMSYYRSCIDIEKEELITQVKNRPLTGFRVGLPSAFSIEECPECIVKAWQNVADSLESLGADIVIVPDSVIHPDTVQNSLAAYYVLACAEASSNLMRYDGLRYGATTPNATLQDVNKFNMKLSPLEQQYANSRSNNFGSEVKRRILCGTAVLSSDYVHTYYESASKLRVEMTREFESAFNEYCDLLLVPTTISPPPRLFDDIGATAMLRNDIMTVPISLAGLPTISFPTKDGCSFQLVGAKNCERKVLKVASSITTSL